MKSRLAIDRMSDGALWKRLRASLTLLDPKFVPITGGERQRVHGAFYDALACVRELEMRGVQLRLDVDTPQGSESK